LEINWKDLGMRMIFYFERVRVEVEEFLKLSFVFEKGTRRDKILILLFY